MPTYRVTDPKTGRTLRLTGDSPPTEQELEDIFAAQGGAQEPEPAGQPSGAMIGPARQAGILERGWNAIPSEGIPGILKGAVREGAEGVAALGDMARAGWNMVAPDSLQADRPYQRYESPEGSKWENLGKRGVQAYTAVQGGKAAYNLGRAGLSGAAELGRKAIGASTKRGAEGIETVVQAAGKEPLVITDKWHKPINEILKNQSAGENPPRAVMKLIDRLTDPDLDPITLEEARRSVRLTSKWLGRGKSYDKVMRRDVAQLRDAIHSSIAKTADDAQAGLGGLYDDAVKEYARGSRLSASIADKKKILGKAALYGAGGTAASGATAGLLYRLFGSPFD